MTITMNRRAFVRPLCAAPAALLASPAGACTLKLETPVRRLHSEWAALSAILEDHNHPMTEADLDAGCEERFRIEVEIMSTPAEDAEDVLLKIGSWTRWGQDELTEHETFDWDALWAEARALMGVQDPRPIP